MKPRETDLERRHRLARHNIESLKRQRRLGLAQNLKLGKPLTTSLIDLPQETPDGRT